MAGFRILDDGPAADPKIGQPEELTFAEKYLAPLLEKTGLGDAAGGNVRGSAVGRLAMGAADPGVAIAQLAANAVGAGDSVNKGIKATEDQYQAARKEAGSSGFDPLRMVGQTGMSLMIPGATAAGSGILKGAATGAGFGALNPVTNGGENFWTDKAKETAIGAGTGAIASPLMGALARLVSPKASTNANLKLLQDEKVQPSIGQSLGGWANAAEEKLQSVPIVGDAIAAMRNRAREQFNNAAINRSQAPIGARVEGSGQKAIAEAGDNLSAAYNDALGSVDHVNFDTPNFNAQLGQLQDMATGLAPDLANKFDRTLSNVVLRKMSPNGSMAGADLKAVDSELGQLAGRFRGSSTASEQEFGDAVKQLQSILKQEVAVANPDVAQRLAAADKGWANLVRVEGAGKAAVNNEGVFTPAQLNGAIRGADQSVRDRATARGTALMQDLGNAGQQVLGNKVPDSGTTGRVFLGLGGLAAGAVHPGIPLALGAGAAAYAPPIQNFLRYLITQRPDQAPAVANYLRELARPATVAALPLLEQGNR